MKSIFFKVTAFIIFLLSLVQAPHAEWTQLNGLFGGKINVFAINGNTIFAGTEGSGIFRSSNNGTSWTEANNGIYDDAQGRYIEAIAVSGNSVFAGTWGDGVLLSTDNGASWTQVNNGLMNSLETGLIKSFLVIGSDIFAGTQGGLFLSADNGAHWTPKNSGFSDSSVWCMTASDNSIFAGTGGGVYFSTDTGAHWNAVSTGVSLNYWVSDMVQYGTNLYAATAGGLYRFTNTGSNWTSIKISFDVSSLAVMGSRIIAGAYDGKVYITKDSAATWTESGPELFGGVKTFAKAGQNLFAGTNPGGVFISTDSGDNWMETDSGFTALYVGSFAEIGTNLFVGTDFGIHISTDQGFHWRSVLHNPNVGPLLPYGRTLFAVVPGGIIHSRDNGDSWSGIDTTLRFVISFAAVDSGILAGTSNGVYISKDTGGTWKAADSTMANSSINSLAVSGGKIFAGTNKTVMVSTNNGENWNPLRSDFTADVRAIAFVGNNLFMGTNDSGIFISSNDGSNLRKSINAGLPDMWFSEVSCFATRGTDLFAGTNSEVFLLRGNDTGWTRTNLNKYAVQSLYISDNYLLVGTSFSGIWLRPLSEMEGVIVPKPQKADAFRPIISTQLQQFRTIGFSLSNMEKVSVKAYNLSGREIVTIADGYFGPGPHSLKWNTGNLAAGCYAVRMQAGTDIYAKSVLISR